MTIVKLILVEDEHFRFNPTRISYHLNAEIAKSYAEKMIKKGTTRIGYNAYGDMIKSPVAFKKNYTLEYIDVNEEG